MMMVVDRAARSDDVRVRAGWQGGACAVGKLDLVPVSHFLRPPGTHDHLPLPHAWGASQLHCGLLPP